MAIIDVTAQMTTAVKKCHSIAFNASRMALVEIIGVGQASGVAPGPSGGSERTGGGIKTITMLPH